MLFTEIKSDQVLGPHIDHVKCSACSQTGFRLRGSVKYLSVGLLNLPLFVFKREYEFSCGCGHCQKPFIKRKHLKMLKRQMLPVSYFLSRNVGALGLVILLTFGLLGFVMSI